MSCFVRNANLPIDAKVVIFGEKYSAFLSNSLILAGYTPLCVPDNSNVDSRVSGHADLSVFHAGGEHIILAPYLEGSSFAQAVADMGADICFAAIHQSKKYPHDAQLNALSLGNRLICCRNATACEVIKSFDDSRGGRLLLTKQGYSACSICVVDENSIITSDPGIAFVCERDGMDVLFISPGFFSLEGYDLGFIGGSSFKLSETKLAFTGTLDGHPDRERILAFLDVHGVEPVFLTGSPAFDIGGAVPLTEKNSNSKN